jgi:hypothetical protein
VEFMPFHQHQRIDLLIPRLIAAYRYHVALSLKKEHCGLPSCDYELLLHFVSLSTCTDKSDKCPLLSVGTTRVYYDRMSLQLESKLTVVISI